MHLRKRHAHITPMVTYSDSAHESLEIIEDPDDRTFGKTFCCKLIISDSHFTFRSFISHVIAASQDPSRPVFDIC
jgi:hypothetical protein